MGQPWISFLSLSAWRLQMGWGLGMGCGGRRSPGGEQSHSLNAGEVLEVNGVTVSMQERCGVTVSTQERSPGGE